MIGRLRDWYRKRRRKDRAGVREGGGGPVAAGLDDGREFLLPVRSLDELFPGATRLDVAFPASQIVRRRDMVLPLPDLLTLATLAKRVAPARIFEIGTYTGESTLLMAMNTPLSTSIFTLDLPPPDPAARKQPTPPSFTAGSAYVGSPSAPKITQLYGDSRTFDFSPWAGTIDLVLVDANHTYPFVKVDSQTALRLRRPGGVIVWDDYVWVPEYPECAGVAQYLHELQRSIPCYRVAGTRLAAYVGDAPIGPGSR